MLTGLNHITLAVADVDASFEFYVSTLGFKPHAKWQRGAYLSLADVWLCLSYDKPKPGKDYTHIAWDIAAEDFPILKQKLLQAGIREWKTNSSEGESLYILDPDGHKLEIHAGSLQSRLVSLRTMPYDGLQLY